MLLYYQFRLFLNLNVETFDVLLLCNCTEMKRFVHRLKRVFFAHLFSDDIVIVSYTKV